MGSRDYLIPTLWGNVWQRLAHTAFSFFEIKDAVENQMELYFRIGYVFYSTNHFV